MEITVTQLKTDLFRILDGILETGEPVVIRRKGKVLRISTEPPRNRLGHLVVRNDVLKCSPDDIIHMDWSDLWNP